MEQVAWEQRSGTGGWRRRCRHDAGRAFYGGSVTTSPAGSAPSDAEREANRANWDERVPVHLVAYDAEGFITDPQGITSVAREDIALMAPHLPAPHDASRPLADLDLLHLQCHVGTDTLSYARAGAVVTGLDFSPASITAARNLAERAGLEATFIESDVAQAAAALDGATFDVVTTSIGVLPWIADLRPWAAAIATALRGGGLFFLRDGHPMLSAVDDEGPEARAGRLMIVRPYFPTGAPLRYDDGTDYADEHAHLDADVTYEWPHPLSEVVQTLLDAGLVLTSLAEHTTIPWRALPHMIQTETGYGLPEGRERLPLTFSLTARKP